MQKPLELGLRGLGWKTSSNIAAKDFLKVRPLDFGRRDRKAQGKVMMLCSILFGEAQDNNLLIVFRLSLVPRQLNTTCSPTSPFHSDAT
jgi:hypothetical protein